MLDYGFRDFSLRVCLYAFNKDEIVLRMALRGGVLCLQGVSMKGLA